jgi:stringent starvation protein B
MTDGSPPSMTSHRPYLLRALYAWIVDNGMTPYLQVDAGYSGVQVPAFAVNDGKVVLNIAERAVAGLEMGNDRIRFTARFGGVSHAVSIPVGAVQAIYARETAQGMVLPEEPVGPEVPETSVADTRNPSMPMLDLAAECDAESHDGDDHQPPPRRSGHLRLVK